MSLPPTSIGKPQQNAFIESFNGSLRDELLNEELFDSLAEARCKLAVWRYDYNNIRQHSSMGEPNTGTSASVGQHEYHTGRLSL